MDLKKVMWAITKLTIVLVKKEEQSDDMESDTSIEECMAGKHPSQLGASNDCVEWKLYIVTVRICSLISGKES